MLWRALPVQRYGRYLNYVIKFVNAVLVAAFWTIETNQKVSTPHTICIDGNQSLGGTTWSIKLSDKH